MLGEGTGRTVAMLEFGDLIWSPKLTLIDPVPTSEQRNQVLTEARAATLSTPASHSLPQDTISFSKNYRKHQAQWA